MTAQNAEITMTIAMTAQSDVTEMVVQSVITGKSIVTTTTEKIAQHDVIEKAECVATE